MNITIIEEWDYYDGFQSGIVRIQHDDAFHTEGDLYYAEAVVHREDDDAPVPCTAWSLFHAFHAARGDDIRGAIADPGPIHFTYAELYASPKQSGVPFASDLGIASGPLQET